MHLNQGEQDIFPFIHHPDLYDITNITHRVLKQNDQNKISKYSSSGCLHCRLCDYIKADICFCISPSMYLEQISGNSNRLEVWQVWQSICHFSLPSLTQLKYPRLFVDLRKIKAGSYKSRFPIQQSEEWTLRKKIHAVWSITGILYNKNWNFMHNSES